MSNAYYSEPSAPGGGAVAQGLDSAAAIAAPAGAGRRISANSFRLLTAKLKKAPVPDLMVLEAAEVPAAAIVALHPRVEETPPAAIEIAVAPEVLPLPFIELPQFQPIEFYATHQEFPAEAPLVHEPEPAGPVGTEAELAPEPDLAALPEFILEPVSFDAPEDEIVEAPPAEPQPEPELQAAEMAVDEPAAIEAEVFAEPEVAALPLYEEPPAVVEDAAEPAEAAPLADEPASAEAATDEPAEPASEPQAAALQDEEAKTRKSELADRVVEAMIKTISTAVYAKPSASERAAFLREMAAIMEQDAAANGEPAPVVQEAAIIAVHEPAPVESVEQPPIAEALASRIGPAAALLKPKAGQGDDPFAQNLTLSRLVDPKPAETVDADEESGELAITLLDMMSGGAGTALPHERTLAADTLLRILPRIPVKQLLAVVERVAIMETPPALLVAKLIRDSRHDVVAPLLERCSHISDQDLMNAAPDGDVPKLRMIARRRILSTVLSDYLIGIGEPGVLLTLIRNPGAAFSHAAFFRLAEHATHHHSLLAPLATRADLPPPVAFELFWHVPQELRRFIFSRFLTDSETLNKILRITLATHADASNDVVGEGKFPSREAIESAVEHAANYRLEEASRQFAEIGSIARDTALRILSDREGEPITVLFKALGYPRSKFEDALARLRHSDSGVLRPDRNPEEMQAIFDSLSFNKARILLTYWDWFVRKAGPYSPHN